MASNTSVKIVALQQDPKIAGNELPSEVELRADCIIQFHAGAKIISIQLSEDGGLIVSNPMGLCFFPSSPEKVMIV